MKTTTISMISAGLMAAIVPTAIAATNLLTNGTFETGVISPWTTTGTVAVGAASANAGVDTFSATGSPDAPGTQDVSFSTASTSSISQTVNLTKGTIYSIGYDAALFGALGTNVTISVTLNGVTLAGLALTQAGFSGVNTWVEKIITYSAPLTVAGATFTFTDTNAGTTTKLAADRLYITNIPEPSSMVLLAGGAFGLWRMRRRARG